MEPIKTISESKAADILMKMGDCVIGPPMENLISLTVNSSHHLQVLKDQFRFDPVVKEVVSDISQSGGSVDIKILKSGTLTVKVISKYRSFHKEYSLKED